MGFFDKNRSDLAAKGFADSRLPLGQYLTDRFPVLHVGNVPTYQPGEWNLTVDGLVGQTRTVSLDELRAMPSTKIKTDIHCVTKWSKFDTHWTGVRVRDFLQIANVSERATHVMCHGEYGYCANVPLIDIIGENSLIAYEFEGKDIEPIHGGPVRLVVPHLYFWKSTKWLRRLELMPADAPGFWEENGYHMYGDPFQEQRFTDD